jgi:SAM-dependent methyltransferase
MFGAEQHGAVDVKFLKRLFRHNESGPFSSSDYWAKRYERGKTSGSGSYGRLASYKADVINQLVRDRAVGSVVEFGCGDGNQAALFDFETYTGVDVAPLVISSAQIRFADRETWQFVESHAFEAPASGYDLSMSLDVIYHLVEAAVFDRYMRDLVAASARYVLVYASDHDAATKDVHVRHRRYSDWMAAHAPEFDHVQTWDHPYPMTETSDKNETSFAFFQLFERGATA